MNSFTISVTILFSYSFYIEIMYTIIETEKDIVLFGNILSSTYFYVYLSLLISSIESPVASAIYAVSASIPSNVFAILAFSSVRPSA